MIKKISHTKDVNGDDVQETITITAAGTRRYVFIKRHGKFQGREIYYTNEEMQTGKRCEIFTFDQTRWDELVAKPLVEQ